MSAHPTQKAAYAYVGAFADELVRHGVEHVCVCPGSRSTPLLWMFEHHTKARVWMHIDERSAAYFALGMAKASGKPVALLATSGTAVANFLPAVVEAYLARVPLLLLTADRPREARETGTSQTIDQVGIFGTHVKWCVDLPLPEADVTMMRHARTVAARAATTARSTPAGPVHLNFPFREPLIPLPDDASSAALPERLRFGASADGGGAGYGPRPRYVDVWREERGLSAKGAAALVGQLAARPRGIIVCGPETPAAARGPIGELAKKLRYPILADPLSGLRTTGDVHPYVIDAYDAFLRFDDAVNGLAPEAVVRFGAPPVSKPLSLYLAKYADVPTFVVDEGDGWRDPTLAASDMVYGAADDVCRALLGVPVAEGDARWPALWQRLNRGARGVLDGALAALDEPFEGRVLRQLADLLPADASLYVGNSMPVRDMDTFFPTVPKRMRVFGNRGAAGIDGVTSSALGVAAVTDEPTVLVLGDLSFYHDLNGLLAAKWHDLSLTVVLINNDGGGIFSFLPQAEHPNGFEKLFGTPLGIDFRPVVDMYGGTFTSVADGAGFRHAVRKSLTGGGLHVVEVVTERARNVQLHRDIIGRVGPAVREKLVPAPDARPGRRAAEKTS